MTRLIALTRGVSGALAHCELTHLPRAPVDVARARSQHAAYETILRELGCDVVQIPADDAFPDCVFIEDTALVLDEVAVIARPGAESRRGECVAVTEALSRWRKLLQIEAPALLDGGDLLLNGTTIHVGMSSRSNVEGAAHLEAALKRFGYRVRPVEIRGCLHLKSAACRLDDETIIVNPQWCHPETFDGHRILEVDPTEPHAANVLRVDDTIVAPESCPATCQRLMDAGFETVTVPADELAKAEGSVSCCSLVFQSLNQ